MAETNQPKTTDLTGGSLRAEITPSWLGKDVSSILTIDDISNVILLKAMTSATYDIDARNILKSIEKATKFESPSTKIPEHMIWQALLVTKQGKYIHYLAQGEWVHVTLENGAGIFKIYKEKLY